MKDIQFMTRYLIFGRDKNGYAYKKILIPPDKEE
jgi:hypothetical protein